MARAALSLSIEQLAQMAGVRPMTVSAFERGGNAYQQTVDRLRGALESGGVIFIAADASSLGGGPGVRLRG